MPIGQAGVLSVHIRHGRWGMEHIFQASEYGKLNSKNFLLKEFFDSCACFVRARVFDFAHA